MRSLPTTVVDTDSRSLESREFGGWPRRVHLFGIQIDAVTMAETLAILQQWLVADEFACRFVVTPNVDHLVILNDHAELRAAYADAGLVLADGWPVVSAAGWLGRPLPERVPGSDLVPNLFRATHSGAALRVFLLGAAPGVADRAARRIEDQWPAVRVVGTDSPPLGFERQPEECDRILARIAAAAPDLLVVGFGAPKQELWVHRHRSRIRAKVAICAGATIDFLAGEKQRAPVWMQRCRLEWLHRIFTDPRRLLRRYARDAWVFPQLVGREWKLQGPAKRS